MRYLALVVVTIGASLAVPAAAKTPPANVKLSPAAPYEDDDVKVSFTSPSALKSGYTYGVTITGCDSTAASKDVKPPRKAGQRITVSFKPSDEIVQSGWCRGRAKVRISRAKGENFDKLIATKEFRFRKQP